MNELIAKLEAQIASDTARQETILVAANADGVSDEDRAKKLAEFDAIEVSKQKSRECLNRGQKAAKDQADVQANHREPAAAAIVQKPFNPLAAVSGTKPTVPAEARRHGTLKAFKGPDADERAYQSGLWVAATMYGHKPSLEKLANWGIEPQATLNSINNAGAAYFVPPVFDMAVLELQELYGVCRRRADIVPMSSEIWKGPRWTVGMNAYWISQGTAPTQSEPGWDMIELVAKDLATFGKMSKQLNEDALIDLGDKWAMAAAVAFSYAEDNAAFNGDGTSTYGGITGLFTKIAIAGNAASVYTATGHTTPSALTITDYASVVGKYPAYPGANPCWFCHKEVWANSILPLQMNAGGALPIHIQEGGKPQMLGYDVEFTQVAPKVASATTGTIPILFGDLNLSTKLGDRRQRTLQVGMINDDMIKQLLTLFAASRVDIINHTITDPKNNAAAGPVIGLKLG